MRNILLRCKCAIIYCTLFFTSCSYRELASVCLLDKEKNPLPLYALSKAAMANNNLKVSSKKPYVYELAYELPIAAQSVLSVEYEIVDSEMSAENIENQSLAVRINNDNTWLLPLDSEINYIYSVPITSSSIKKISIFSVQNEEKKSKKEKSRTQNDFMLSVKSFFIDDIFYGIREKKEPNAKFAVEFTPFVEKTLKMENMVYTIDPPPKYAISYPVSLRLYGISSSEAHITFGNTVFNYSAGKNITAKQILSDVHIPYANNLFFSPDLMPENPYPIIVDGSADAVILSAETPRYYASGHLPNKDPIVADPGPILFYPQTKWRNPNYEYFSWDIFPNIIIFDTKNYDVQDSLLKRLAFFAEKKGFRGRIASDLEIKDLHGWNAHDYSPETLANFFNAVAKINFPLSKEELELRDIVIAAGIILASSNMYVPGNGALISISRESADYQRKTLFVHEAFHGIFFVDADFRNFSAERWKKFDPVSKRFLLSFFDYQQYDIKDNFLVINEFMAYCLQQAPGASAEYFGKTKAKLLEAHEWRFRDLPAKDEKSDNWPQLAAAFYNETAVFSDYVNSRWGLNAGKVWRVLPNN
ncbi:MAG: hypothetical protein Ta2B_26970 [Termitinemataceae bacterium]|nr:MAG: hypothetical protein Ta2B_26970 [Termitinemataceae bacterium]